MISLSYPAYFSSGAKKPPIIEKAMSPVCGEMVETTVRLQPITGVPTRRPVAKMRRFSGEKGSTSGGTLSHRILALVPRPPR